MNQYCKREYRYEWDTLYQKCTKCWEWYTSDNFYKSTEWKLWIKPNCKECSRKKRTQYYWENKDIENERYRNYRIRNKNKEIERHRKYRENNLEKRRELSKRIAKEHSEDMWFNRGSFHDKANRYVRKYWLRPKVCPICQRSWKIKMHHPYYNSFDDWSEVVFCCQSCHWLIHNGRIKCPEPINLIYLITDER